MTTPTPLRAPLAAAVPAAMRARDRDRLRVLRATLGVLDNAEAVPVTAFTAGALEQAPVGAGATEAPRRDLSELEVVALVRAEADERERAATTYDDLGDDARAGALRDEARVLRDLLDERA